MEFEIRTNHAYFSRIEGEYCSMERFYQTAILLYLWWHFTLMFGKETAAISIEKFFECFNLQTEFCTLVGVFHT